MIGLIERVLFEKKETGYTVLLMRCISKPDNVPDSVFPDGTSMYNEKFTVIGNYIPTSKDLKYSITGLWDTGKYGKFLQVSEMTEIVESTEDGIMAYLTSGLIKGLGPVTARKIYDKFGNDTLKILDEDPERLSEISGISSKKLEKIIESYQLYRGARDVVSVLAPLGVSANRAVVIYQKFKGRALDIVKNNPYKLCEIPGIGFLTADSIARKNGLSPKSPERAACGVDFALFQNEAQGHLFMYMDDLYAYLYKLLSLPQTIEIQNLFKTAIIGSQSESRIKISRHPEDSRYIVYSRKAFDAENGVAMALKSMLADTRPVKTDLSELIEEHEAVRGVRLAPEQRAAVTCGLSNKFSIITGGPGTGKTTIIDFIASLYKKMNKSVKEVLCAPTGKAARRMTESTGMESFTVHRVLSLQANEEGYYDKVTDVDCDLIIIDETSMLDIYLTNVLLQSLSYKTKVVFIGDVDQLPSVGPGAVLYELIESKMVPTVRLTKVYRQNSGSKIATNAALINHGTWSLDYDDSFQFIPVDSFEEAAEKMAAVYKREIDIEGIDNVIMLSPMRQKTLTGVNNLNNAIHDTVNVPSPRKAEMTLLSTTFRVGDKVMQMKNVDEIMNGDTGEILAIKKDSDDFLVKIDFGDERVVDYYKKDMQNVALSYATTIHKSQGSEYNCVIINLMNEHSIMLKRNLIYTAITRAKEKVIIIGQKQAIITAIQRGMTDKDRRHTLLAKRLQLIPSTPVVK